MQFIVVPRTDALVMVAMAIGSAPSRCRGFGMLVALDILAWSPNVMTGEWARHTIRILRFQVLYGNIPGVQIPIPHPNHTRRPKLHSRTKFQATEKQQEQQPQPIDAKHRPIYCYNYSSVQAEGAKRASSKPAKHE